MIKAVGYETSALKTTAQALADQLHLELDKDAAACLFLSANSLSLKIPQMSLLAADFHAATWYKRKLEGKKQGLVRACKPQAGLTIIDATAGWGRDAAILASFGARVIMLERNPILAALLRDALMRRTDEDKLVMNLSLIETDALDYLVALKPEDFPDIILIDPMHPQRQKSALVKKDLQILQQLIGPDADALELITCARSCVRQKVVVKWPQKAKALVPADASIEGKTIRFDMYF
ncbi:MAG: class I SAM-dependent methyltransferase [Legionella sp.]|jgi:16S rRNA (guanine1516-N2)-methyltransferase